MTTRTAKRLSRAGLVATASFAVVGITDEIVRGLVNQSFISPLLMVALLAFATVGSIIVSRQTSNAIGWMFVLFATLQSSGYLVESLAAHADHHALLPRIGEWWAALNTGPGPIVMFAFLLLLFPDGAPASRRWRKVVVLAMVSTVAVFVIQAIMPGKLENTAFQPVNPFGIDSLRAPLLAVQGPAFLGLLGSVLLGAISLVFRFRRAGGEGREQIKWFAMAGAFVAVSFAVAPVLFWSKTPVAFLWPAVFVLDTLSIPLACGIAITRYRLYDIDRIISRTVAYLLITATLVGIFALVVLTPTLVIGQQGHTPDYVIAVATLTVAALFRPVRRRAQAAVDHRFNRARYDAQRTVEEFGARLRQQVDLDALAHDLETVVTRTVQPAHLSLWMRARP